MKNIAGKNAMKMKECIDFTGFSRSTIQLLWNNLYFKAFPKRWLFFGYENETSFHFVALVTATAIYRRSFVESM